MELIQNVASTQTAIFEGSLTEVVAFINEREEAGWLLVILIKDKREWIVTFEVPHPRS